MNKFKESLKVELANIKNENEIKKRAEEMERVSKLEKELAKKLGIGER